ncbi:MAG: dihydroneopterin aldolase [Prevotella sp.]|jgi:dihydroneopterin aldolase
MLQSQSFIVLSHIHFHAFHGVLSQERIVGNDYDLSLRIGYNIEPAAKSDDVNKTINYADVYHFVAEEMTEPCNLLETVANNICQGILNRWPDALSVDLTILKTNPPIGADCEGAGVELHLINNKTQHG